MEARRKAAAGLRQSALRSRKSRSQGKGWRGGFRDRFDIPKADGEYILLTRASYDDPEYQDEETGEQGVSHYHVSTTHSVRLAPSGKGAFYTARCAIDHARSVGEDSEKVDCLHCFRKERGDRRIGEKSNYNFNLIHFGLFDKVQAERDGKKIFYDTDGKNHKRGDPIMNWEQVTKPRAKKEILAKIDDLVDNGEVRMFLKKYIEVGVGFKNQLATLEDEANKFCRCGGTLAPIAFRCEKCDEILVHVEEDDMDTKEVNAFSLERQRCEHCRHAGFPMAEYVCDSCDDPAALTAFDVVVKIRKRGEGTQTTLIFEDVIPVADFELPNGAPLVEFDGKEVEEDEDGNWQFNGDYELRKLATSQFDFDQILTPPDNAWVAIRLKCDNPFPSKTGTSRYRNYGEGDSPRDDDENEDGKEETRGRGGRGERTGSSRRGASGGRWRRQ